MFKSTLEPAFVLHARPWSETSLILDFFTLEHGRVSAMARSARGVRSRLKNCLVPFSPLLISYRGKNELMQLSTVEQQSAGFILHGRNLFSGIYLNELLLKLLQRFDPYPNLFQHYQTTLQQLQAENADTSKVLRQFEKKLLSELGYGLNLNLDANGDAVLPERFYTYDLAQGLVISENKSVQTSQFQGHHLLAIQQNKLENTDTIITARNLMRAIIAALLGPQKIKSRELF